MKKIILCVAIATIGLVACDKNEILPSDHRMTSPYLEMCDEYNRDFDQVAFVVNKLLLKSAEFRKIVYEAVEKQFDGDYDVLISQLIIDYPSTQQMFYDCNLNIGLIVEKYPLIQIAIPMNFEKWDASPIHTVYLPCDYDEGVTPMLFGYDPDGMIWEIDEKKEPDFPVVVISENERMPIQKAPCDGSPPPYPSEFTGVITEDAIELQWIMPVTTNGDNTTGYMIYRMDNNTDYKLIYTSDNHIKRSYTDEDIRLGNIYHYYMVVYNDCATSSERYCNNGQAFIVNTRPAAAATFKVEQEALNHVRLRWTFAQNQYGGNINIYKRLFGSTGSGMFVNSVPTLNDFYDDTNVVSGQKIEYKIERQTAVGAGIPSYDFIYTPYRDISKPSKVYIRRIKYSDVSKIESWWKGKPEFDIKVFGVSGTTTTEIASFNNIELGSRKDDKWTVVKNYQGNVTNYWKPGKNQWYDAYSFYIIEKDDADGSCGWETLYLIAKKVAKALTDSTKNTWDNQYLKELDVLDKEVSGWCAKTDDKIGYAYLNYYDNPFIEYEMASAETGGFMTIQFSDNSDENVFEYKP